MMRCLFLADKQQHPTHQAESAEREFCLRVFVFQEILFDFIAQAAFGIMDCSNFDIKQKIQPKLAQAPDSEELFKMCLI